MKRIIVLGGGSAGYLAALTIKSRLPHLEVVLLHSSELGIIGVGEGTLPSILEHLHGYIGIDIAKFHQEVRPSWKLGIRFKWGPRPQFHYAFRTKFDTQYKRLSRATGFYCDDHDADYLEFSTALMRHDRVFERKLDGSMIIGNDVGYHLENERFVAFLALAAREMGIQQRDVLVKEVLQNEEGIRGLRVSDREVIAGDLYVDCSGFRSLLLGETFHEPLVDYKSSLFCDTAIVGGWERGPDEPIKPYTTSETMTTGWCWQIEHEERINRGYVFASAFQSHDDAEREFREKCPKVTNTRFVKFRSGRYERGFVKNVVAIGNSSGFVEPLEATALGVICQQSSALAEVLVDAGDAPVSESMKFEYNTNNARYWDAIRQFLAIHYKFNRRLDTPFWRECWEKTELGSAERIVRYFQENGPSILWKKTLVDQADQFHIDGYWALLTGMQVPYRKSFLITPQERQAVHEIQTAIHRKVQTAFTVEQSFALIRSPQWKWSQAFYRRLYPHLILNEAGS